MSEVVARYEPDPIPSDPNKLSGYLEFELRRIGTSLRAVEGVHLDSLHAAPDKPRDGMLVLADGTDWNPGSGEGFYGYYNAAWNKLG
jgi:hypothetical protein